MDIGTVDAVGEVDVAIKDGVVKDGVREVG